MDELVSEKDSKAQVTAGGNHESKTFERFKYQPLLLGSQTAFSPSSF